jgi:hypothetical protein
MGADSRRRCGHIHVRMQVLHPDHVGRQHHDGRQRDIDGAVPTPTIKVELSSWQLALSPRTTCTSQQHPHRCWQKHAILPDVFNIGRCLPLSLAQQLVGDLANAMANTCFSLESVKERLVREISQQHELA